MSHGNRGTHGNPGSSGQPLGPDCAAAREALLGDLPRPGRAVLVPATFHCASCAAWFAETLRQAEALSSLSRSSADATALEGRVVAALNAGFRQARATAALASVERHEPPSWLGQVVAERLARSPQAAPRELDRRVAQELAGGAGDRVERRLGRLTRLAAPTTLEGLVVRELAEARRGAPIGGPRARSTFRWAALAAAFVVAVGAVSLALRERLGRGKAYEFRVVHTASVGDLDPFSRGLFAGASGWLEVPAPSTRDVRQGGGR